MDKDTEKNGNHLAPIKHRQRDLFIADLFDTACFKADIASMEYPLFALKGKDNRVIRYEQNNFKVKISPEIELGRATIHDKDIWIYCISKIMHAMNENRAYDRTIHFTIYDYLKSTNRGTSGRDYLETKNSLERLASTRITTEIETDKIKEAQGFGLVDAWRIIEEKDGRMVRVSVTLPDWLYRSVEAKHVLTISSDYFRLRKPLDRRIYELARKHCGNNRTWQFKLKTLLERTGSTTSLKAFRQAIKSLAESNQLPDYAVSFDIENDNLIFTNRNYKQKTQAELEKTAQNQKAKVKRLVEEQKTNKAKIRKSKQEQFEKLLEKVRKIDYSNQILTGVKTGNQYRVDANNMITIDELRKHKNIEKDGFHKVRFIDFYSLIVSKNLIYLEDNRTIKL